MPVISGKGRRENLYSKGQKFLSREGRDNWDKIEWVKYPDEVKKDAWEAQLRREGKWFYQTPRVGDEGPYR